MAELAVHKRHDQPFSGVTTSQPYSSHASPHHPQHPPHNWQPHGAPMQQQMNTNTNIVINNQTVATGRPAQRAWSHGLFGCFSDISSCLMALFCPCCLQCGILQDMGESCCSSCLYVSLCSPITLFGLRALMRGKENIQGTLYDDLCLTAGCFSPCCHCCALAQLAHEVKIVKNVKGYV
nr:cornifelin-like protein A-like [Biomphalaria glabrata]